MPTLRNPRHERFAQELATGKTADAAYVLAGYRANRSNAARLSASRDIQKRVAEIQSLGAERAAVTVETLIAEAEAARSKAMGEKGGAAAAVAAITAKAKLAGLWREKVAQTDPSGENAPRYIISDRPMTEEEWIRERCGENERPMAGRVGLSPVFICVHYSRGRRCRLSTPERSTTPSPRQLMWSGWRFRHPMSRAISGGKRLIASPC